MAVMLDPCLFSFPQSVAYNCIQLLTYPGQLSLAIPPWVGAIKYTGQMAVMLCGWGVIGWYIFMVREWVAGKTV